MASGLDKPARPSGSRSVVERVTRNSQAHEGAFATVIVSWASAWMGSSVGSRTHVALKFTPAEERIGDVS
jgi:hypothetical protein